MLTSVGEAPVSAHVPERPGRLGEQRGEPDHPAEERGVVHLDTAFGEQLLDVPVGQPEAHVPGTASVITSGGKRNPANSERAAATRRVDLIHSRVPNRQADRPRFQRNSALSISRRAFSQSHLRQNKNH